jgi:hypothetical protein
MIGSLKLCVFLFLYFEILKIVKVREFWNDGKFLNIETFGILKFCFLKSLKSWNWGGNEIFKILKLCSFEEFEVLKL